MLVRRGAEVEVESIVTGKRRRLNLHHCKALKPFELSSSIVIVDSESLKKSVPNERGKAIEAPLPDRSEVDTNDQDSDYGVPEVPNGTQQQPVKRGKREVKPPVHLKDFIM